MDYTFSDRVSQLKPSAIREILKFTSVPGIIPFAAGNPAPEAFPVEEIQKLSQEILSQNPILALQYSITEGYTPLREHLETYMKQKHNTGRDFDNIIITAGAQQVMDLSAKALCNEHDTVICENPSFIGSLNAFRSYNLKLCGIEVEEDGMNMEKLEQALKTEQNVRFIYTIPNFQNPSGVTMSFEKRKQMYQLAKKYNVIIIEDNPYGDIRFSGQDIPTIKSLDEDGIVIYAGSFSKVLSPGLRVGFCIAPEQIISKLVVCKQVSDVHTGIFNQILAYEFMTRCNYESHLERIRSIYRHKARLMMDLIEQHLTPYVTYTKVEGGLFTWCRLPDSVDMLQFCKAAIDKGVAVVPGTAFCMSADEPSQCFRLNYSTPTDEQIVKGLELLGQTIKSII
ncbi:MAG TPA: PLP-dependent aminotransferase family protein [Clostridiales bacterium]|nr:PLP-dependent aminotransferase family protein [Clostridiales bacterium]